MPPSPAQPVLGKTSLLQGSISIKASATVAPPRPRLQVDVKPLTQDDLERLWHEAGEQLGLAELLSASKVKLGDAPNTFDVEATTVYFSDDFKPHKIDVLQFIRNKTGLRMLDCKVIPLYINKEAIPYSAEEKYRIMVKQNPQLAELIKIFPEIDI